MVLVPERSDEWTNMIGAFEVVEQFELVEDAEGTAGNVYLLYSDVAWFVPVMCRPFTVWRGPLGIFLLIYIPVVPVVVVVQVLGLVDC